MPTYTFRCRKCTRKTVVNLRIDDPRPTRCTRPVFHLEDTPLDEYPCGGDLVRVFDVPSIAYRSSGFYHTDKVLYDPIKPEDYNPDED